MTTNSERATFDDLTIKIVRSADQTLMTWTGAADLRHPEEELLTYLCGLVDSLVGTRFAIDFRGLSFLNSSILSVILVFMRNLHEKGVQTTLHFNHHTDSQRSASRCLRTLSSSLSLIVVKDGS